MTKLVNKLHALVRASVRGALGNDPDHRAQRRKRIRAGQAPERNITVLRERIDQALDQEDRMADEINTMQRQIAEWDQQADAALQQGNEAAARHAIRQLQLQQQRVTMLQADLDQHKLATAELISHVNELEAVVAEAEQQQAQHTDVPEPATNRVGPPSARLRDMPQAAAQSSSDSVAADHSPSPAAPLEDEQAIEDDLARRRKRLSL